MKRELQTLLIVISFLAASWMPVKGEFRVSGGVFAGNTSYLPSDPIYFTRQGQNIILSYVAIDPAANYTFEWVRYNPLDNSWVQVTHTSVGSSSTHAVTAPGGYLLRVTRGAGNVSTYRCWIFEPRLGASTVNIEYEDCFTLILRAITDSIPLVYSDPATGHPGHASYGKQFSWVGEPATQVGGSRVVEMGAPVEDTRFTLTVTDAAGNISSANLNYTALAVRADYEASVVKADVLNEVHTSTEGSAPIEIRFQNKSKGNITSWEWRFGRAGRAVDRNPFHVFTNVGRDTVSLRVKNDFSGCWHQMENPLVVNVMESILKVPNTFTPNGDGVNDEFRVVYRSLRKFNIWVYNRWGRRVYESNNPAEGWDGTVGGQPGAPGVYFYYIEAEGFQHGERHQLQGPVHLLRGK